MRGEENLIRPAFCGQSKVLIKVPVEGILTFLRHVNMTHMLTSTQEEITVILSVTFSWLSLCHMPQLVRTTDSQNSMEVHGQLWIVQKKERRAKK